MSPIPIPKPSYLDNCDFLGAGHGRKRWRSTDGSRLFEWDSQHGEIEVYNRRGKHLGVFDNEGNYIKGPEKKRTIDV